MTPLFRQDDARVQKVSKRIHTLEEVNINVKLLSDMLTHYDKDRSSESDRELIKVGLQLVSRTCLTPPFS